MDRHNPVDGILKELDANEMASRQWTGVRIYSCLLPFLLCLYYTVYFLPGFNVALTFQPFGWPLRLAVRMGVPVVMAATCRFSLST